MVRSSLVPGLLQGWQRYRWGTEGRYRGRRAWLSHSDGIWEVIADVGRAGLDRRNDVGLMWVAVLNLAHPGQNLTCQSPESREMGLQRVLVQNPTLRDSNQATASDPWESVQGEFPSSRKQSSSQWVDIGGGKEVQQPSHRNLASQPLGYGELSMVLAALPTSSLSGPLPGPG